MNFSRLVGRAAAVLATSSMRAVVHAHEDLPALLDFSQANRRVRRAWRCGRPAKVIYLAVEHQRRRLRRRREIRDLVEGPPGGRQAR